MVRRLLGPALAGALVEGVSACDTNGKTGNGAAARPVAEAAVAPPAEIGEPLYPPAPVPPGRPAVTAAAPIVVRQCQITLAETQNVPSKNSGRLLYYCTEIQPGEVVPPEDVILHPRTKVKYRRLKEGD